MSIRNTSFSIVIALAVIIFVVGALKIRSLIYETASVEAVAAGGLATGRLNKAIIELSLERSLMQVALNLDAPGSDKFRTLLDDQRARPDAVFDDVQLNFLDDNPSIRSQEFAAVLVSLRDEVDLLRTHADAELAQIAADRSGQKVIELPRQMKSIIKKFAHSTLMLRPEGAQLPSSIVTLQYIQRFAWEVREYGGQERTQH